jgi:hypothetical protein
MVPPKRTLQLLFYLSGQHSAVSIQLSALGSSIQLSAGLLPPGTLRERKKFRMKKIPDEERNSGFSAHLCALCVPCGEPSWLTAEC